MRIILKQDVDNLGRKGDIVNVSAGYGRNYLIPRKIALEVTASNMKMIEMERQVLKKRIDEERLSFQDLVQQLSGLILTFRRKAGEKDMIFGSVSAADIKEALEKEGFDIDKKKIILEEPIKRLGNYTIPVRVYHDDKAEIRIEVLKEGGAEEAAQEKPVSKEEKS